MGTYHLRDGKVIAATAEATTLPDGAVADTAQPPQVRPAVHVAPGAPGAAAAVAAAPPAVVAASSALPRAIILDESIGWMVNGALRHFAEGQQITHAGDIAELVAHGARYREFKT